MYNSMLYFFLIGAVLPVIIFLLSKKFPQNKILKKVSYHSREMGGSFPTDRLVPRGY